MSNSKPIVAEDALSVSHNLRIGSLNIRGLRKHCFEENGVNTVDGAYTKLTSSIILEQLMKKHKLDILCLQETFHTDPFKLTAESKMYAVEKRARPSAGLRSRAKGGVAILARVPVKEIATISDDLVAVLVDGKTVVATAYCPPKDGNLIKQVQEASML